MLLCVVCCCLSIVVDLCVWCVACYKLFAVFVACCCDAFRVVCCLMYVVRCVKVLFVARCVVLVVCCLLVGGHLMYAHCLAYAVYGLLFVVCG